MKCNWCNQEIDEKEGFFEIDEETICHRCVKIYYKPVYVTKKGNYEAEEVSVFHSKQEYKNYLHHFLECVKRELKELKERHAERFPILLEEKKIELEELQERIQELQEEKDGKF